MKDETLIDFADLARVLLHFHIFRHRAQAQRNVEQGFWIVEHWSEIQRNISQRNLRPGTDILDLVLPYNMQPLHCCGVIFATQDDGVRQCALSGITGLRSSVLCKRLS